MFISIIFLGLVLLKILIGGGFNPKNATYDWFYTTIKITTNNINLDADSQYGGDYFVNNASLDFSPASSSTIDITANNVTEQFIKITASRSSSYWRLGVLMDYFDYDNVEFNLGAFVRYDTVDNIASLNVKRSTSQGNNLFGVYSPSEEYTDIYIKNNVVLYNQGYMLNIQYLDNGTWKDYDQFLFYFVPPGDSSTSGELINPDLNSDIDLSVIDAFNSLFPTDDLSSDALIGISGTFYSGDLLGSGDLFLSGDSFFGVSFVDYDDWGFGDLVKWIFTSLASTLTSYQDVTMNFGFLGDISSSVFTISNTYVADLLGLITGFLVFLLVVFFYWRFIKHISTLDLDAVINTNVDDMFHLF